MTISAYAYSAWITCDNFIRSDQLSKIISVIEEKKALKFVSIGHFNSQDVNGKNRVQHYKSHDELISYFDSLIGSRNKFSSFLLELGCANLSKDNEYLFKSNDTVFFTDFSLWFNDFLFQGEDGEHSIKNSIVLLAKGYINGEYTDSCAETDRIWMSGFFCRRAIFSTIQMSDPSSLQIAHGKIGVPDSDYTILDNGVIRSFIE
jgi:hypothetical protein